MSRQPDQALELLIGLYANHAQGLPLRPDEVAARLKLAHPNAVQQLEGRGLVVFTHDGATVRLTTSGWSIVRRLCVPFGARVA